MGALSQQQQQDCGRTGSNYEKAKEPGVYGTRTARTMSTSLSSDSYRHGRANEPLTVAVCKGVPYYVFFAGHGDINDAEQQHK